MTVRSYCLLRGSALSNAEIFRNEAPVGMDGRSITPSSPILFQMYWLDLDEDLPAQIAERLQHARGESGEADGLPPFVESFSLMHRDVVRALVDVGISNVEVHDIELRDVNSGDEPIDHALVLANIVGRPSVIEAFAGIQDRTGHLLLDDDKLNGLEIFRPREYSKVALIREDIAERLKDRGVRGLSFSSPRADRYLFDVAVPARALPPNDHFERALRHEDPDEALIALRRVVESGTALDGDAGNRLLAAAIDYPVVVRELLGHGVSHDGVFNRASDPEVIALLQEAGATADTSADALVSASSDDSSQHLLKALLASGADPNARTANGETALDRALGNSCAKNAYHLLRAGADPALVYQEEDEDADIADLSEVCAGLLRSARVGELLCPAEVVDRERVKRRFAAYAAQLESFTPDPADETVYAIGIDGGRLSLNTEERFAQTLARYQAKYPDYQLPYRIRNLRHNPGDWSYGLEPVEDAAPTAAVTYAALEVRDEDLRSAGEMLGDLLNENLNQLTSHLELSEKLWVTGIIRHQH